MQVIIIRNLFDVGLKTNEKKIKLKHINFKAVLNKNKKKLTHKPTND